MTPTLTIIVPIYNVEAYLHRCLDSIYTQTSSDFEVILVDDGSRDQSRVIAEQFSEKDNRFKYYYKDNGGLSDARNFGITRSSGAFIAFVDGDDYVADRFVELMLRKQAETDSKIVVCDMAYVYDTKFKHSSGGDFDVVNVQDQMEFININNSACNKIYHRSLFDKLQFPKAKLYEDLFVVPILLFQANRVARVDQVLYYYVQREGSIVHRINPNIFDIYEAVHHVKCVLTDQVKNTMEFSNIINHMYIEHGLYLTTIRIKESSSFSDQIKYFRLNIVKLDQYYPQWINDSELNKYSIKQRIIFRLLDLKLWWLVALIYRKRFT